MGDDRRRRLGFDAPLAVVLPVHLELQHRRLVFDPRRLQRRARRPDVERDVIGRALLADLDRRHRRLAGVRGEEIRDGARACVVGRAVGRPSGGGERGRAKKRQRAQAPVSTIPHGVPPSVKKNPRGFGLRGLRSQKSSGASPGPHAAGSARARACGSWAWATPAFTAACTFSNARTSIWRTRSRETPNSEESSSSVIGSSASRRASKMRRSRGLSTRQRLAQRAHAGVALLAVGERDLLVGGVVDQPVLPLAFAFLAQRRVERGVAAEAAVHVDHLLLGDAEALGDDGDLIVTQVAVVERRDAALGLAQVEEQLLLAGGGAHLHERPRAQDILLNRGANPPHGVGGELEALVGLESPHRLHQADVALGDHFADRQAVAAIAHRDLGDEAQVRGDELVRGVAIVVFAPALGEHVFFLRLQHREPLDFGKISGKAGFTGNDRQSGGHKVLLATVRIQGPDRRRRPKTCAATYSSANRDRKRALPRRVAAAT